MNGARTTARSRARWGRRAALLLGALAVLLGIGLLEGGRGGVSERDARVLIEEYLQAMAEGDAARLQEMVPADPGRSWPPLVTDEILAASESRLDSWQIVSTRPRSGGVDVVALLEMQGRSVRHEFLVEPRRSGDGAPLWQRDPSQRLTLVGGGFPAVSLTLPAHAETLQVNGVDVPVEALDGKIFPEQGHRTVSAHLVPGVYEFSLPQHDEHLVAEPVTITVGPVLRTQKLEIGALEEELTEAGEETLASMLEEQLTACLEADRTEASCPTPVTDGQEGTWQLGDLPQLSVTQAAQRGWSVRGMEPLTATFTPASGAEPSTHQLRIDATADVSEDGELTLALDGP